MHALKGIAFEVVETNRHAVRANGWVLGNCGLQDSELGEVAVGVSFELRAKGVHTCGLKPVL